MPEPEVYARRLVKGSAIVFAGMVASGIFGIFLRMFLARSLSVEEYGLFYAVFVFVSFFALFRDLGLDPTLTKYIPEFSVKKDFKAIKSLIVSAAIFKAIFAFSIATILFIFSGQIALEFFGTEAAVLPLRILCIWFFVIGFHFILRGAFQGFQNMPAYASMEFFWIMSVFVSAVLFVSVLGRGLSGVASAYLAGALVMVIMSMVYFMRRYPQVFKEKISVDRILAKKLFAFALPIFIGGLGGLILGYMDTLMITVFRSLHEVGYYQVAQPTAGVLWYFVGALTVVFFPMVSELWARRERKLLGRGLDFLIKFSFVLIFPAALVLIAFPEIVIRLLFGEGYLVGGVTALRILAFNAIVYTLYAILVSVMAGIGKPIINTKIIGVMACFNLIGNLILIRPYGIVGAAAATLGSFLLGLVLLFHYARKLVGFTVPSLPLLKTTIGGVLTLFIVFGLKSILVLSPWPEALVVVMLSLVFYGVWILLVKAVTRDDLKLIARIVPMPKWLVEIAGRFAR